MELCIHKARTTWSCPKLKEAGKDCPLEPLEGAWPVDILILDFWPPEQGENTFLSSQATHLLYSLQQP